MSIIRNNILAGASGNQGAYEIQRSLRFNSGDSPSLSFTPSSGLNTQIWTISLWVKKISAGGYIIRAGSFYLYFTSDTLTYYDFKGSGQGSGIRLQTNAVFRDPSAWYHIVLANDLTLATATNRHRLYVNGDEVTSFATDSPADQNTTSFLFNSGYTHYIGGGTANNYPDCYLAEIHFVRGSQLAPSSFGETDSATGAWIPKNYSGSHGTGGAYLNFSDNSGVTATTLGKDSSGNGNNWTPVNFSVTAGADNDSMEDTPTNNWCTMNPLIPTAGTVSNGNLKVVTPSGNGSVYGSFNLPTSGKWYWEFVGTVNGNLGFSGIAKPLEPSTYIVYYGNNGNKWISGTASSYGATYGNNDVIGVAVNVDSNEITFYKNNASQGTITGYTLDEGDYAPIITDGSGAAGTTCDVNFGQRAFEYTPPTGFKALNAKNLPEPTIKDATEYFNTVLWTGDSSTQPITGVGFQPDFVWGKARSVGYAHNLFDTVRGATKSLVSSSTAAEITVSGLTSFDSDGFTVGSNLDLNNNTHTYVAWNWDAGSNSSKTFTVKVVSDSGNKYRFDDFGTSAVTLDLEEGSTYVFDQSDSSNSGHPLRFSTTSDGTHNSGSEYTTGVTTTGTPGSAGAKTTIVVAASAPTLYYYCSSHSGMGGQANTNDTAGASNFAGSIQSTVRVNADAGFSIIQYTGNATAGATVGHGLGIAPRFIITKKQDVTDDWFTYHESAGNTKFLKLNSSNAPGSSTTAWNNTSPTSTVFSLGSSNATNRSGEDFIAYCFAEVEGYSKFGSYTGNGSSDGPFVYTGFRTATVWIKRTDNIGNWEMMDNQRLGYNDDNYALRADLSNAEVARSFDILSNGFKIRQDSGLGNHNASGATYIFMAWAQMPSKYANAR